MPFGFSSIVQRQENIQSIHFQFLLSHTLFVFVDFSCNIYILQAVFSKWVGFFLLYWAMNLSSPYNRLYSFISECFYKRMCLCSSWLNTTFNIQLYIFNKIRVLYKKKHPPPGWSQYFLNNRVMKRISSVKPFNPIGQKKKKNILNLTSFSV